jgi:hypothetical protein
MYVTVSPGGTGTFRYDYRLNGRRETCTWLALEKQHEKRRAVAIKTFGAAMDTRPASRAVMPKGQSLGNVVFVVLKLRLDISFQIDLYLGKL